MQLCFTESDSLKWVDLYWDAVERVASVEEYDAISNLVSSNNYEFWAGFSSFYFTNIMLRGGMLSSSFPKLSPSWKASMAS